MSKLIGTKTEKNLLKSFAGESQARNRYEMFAKVARKEGYEQVAAIFEETAAQEKEHAKRFFRFLEGGNVEITATYPAGKVGTTIENLKNAADGEYEEWKEVYHEFAETAKKEGLEDISTAFKMISKAEEAHEKRYRKLLENIEKSQVFTKPTSVKWYCRNCGYYFEGEHAPDECPACLHPQAYFQILPDNY